MLRNFSFVIPGKLAGMGQPAAALIDDLTRLKAENIGAVISLTEEPLDRSLVEKAGLAYLHLPVPDYHPPQPGQIDHFVQFVADRNADGIAVAAHCAAGIGRTGTMLACYLASLGASGDEAIATVRAKRPGSIETAAQEEAVLDFAKRRSGH